MSRVFDLSITAGLDNLKEIRSFVADTGKSLDIDQTMIGDLCLVVDEAVTNIILHGYDGQSGPIDILLEATGPDLTVRIRDQAPGFDPESVESPHLSESLAERAYGGMGVYLIRKLTDEFSIVPCAEGGNELRLLKRNALGN